MKLNNKTIISRLCNKTQVPFSNNSRLEDQVFAAIYILTFLYGHHQLQCPEIIFPPAYIVSDQIFLPKYSQNNYHKQYFAVAALYIVNSNKVNQNYIQMLQNLLATPMMAEAAPPEESLRPLCPHNSLSPSHNSSVNMSLFSGLPQQKSFQTPKDQSSTIANLFRFTLPYYGLEILGQEIFNPMLQSENIWAENI